MDKSYKILLSLGSNVGDRVSFLKSAVSLLTSQLLNYENEIKVSQIYETEPVGEKDQAFFLNLAICAYTKIKPNDFLLGIKNIEIELGRKDRGKWKEREIDIDIILYENFQINSDQISIPHTHMQFRKFVLFPCNEISPDFMHPTLHKTINQLLNECSDNSFLKSIGNLNDL